VSACFKLNALDPDARYRVMDMVSDSVAEMCGRDLMEKGWLFTLADAPAAAVLFYQKVQKDTRA
jgi:hypothetical protein